MAWLMLGLMAACAAPQDTSPEAQQNLPTPTVEPWRVSGAAIALDNVPQIQQLGRLDQPGGTSTILDYALTPDATRLAVLNNTDLILWDLISGSLVFASGRNEVTQLFFSPDKTEIYGIAPSGGGVVFDAETGARLADFNAHSAYSGTAAFDRENGWLALGGTDGTVKVWDPLERTSLATIQAQAEAITSLAFSTDGERLATAGNDASVRLWNWRERTLLWEWATVQVDAFRLAFSTDTGSLAAGVSNGAFVWSLGDGGERHRFQQADNGSTALLQFSPDGEYLLGGSRPIGISLWRMDTGALISTLPESGGDGMTARFSTDGAMLVTTAIGSPVSIWNLTRITEDTIDRADLPVPSREILALEWTEDGRLLLFFDARGFVYVWGIPEVPPVAETS
jgi:WD40 repeat protein